MTGLQVKLDPSSYPKLSSRGENYTDWRSIWTLALKYDLTWPVVSGKIARPINQGEKQQEWDRDDNKAVILLIGAVDTDLTSSIANCESSPKMWKYLSDRFDRDTDNNSIHLFKGLTKLAYNDGEDLRHHVNTFNEMWVRMTKRCQSSRQPVAKAMRPILELEEAKGLFFLTTLPNTMNQIVDNLSTRDITSFTDIEAKMLDIAENHSLYADDSSAYYTSKRKPQPQTKGKGKGNDKTQSQLECSWCKKQGSTFIGHIYTDCLRLKAYQEKQKQGTASTNALNNKKTKW